MYAQTNSLQLKSIIGVAFLLILSYQFNKLQLWIIIMILMTVGTTFHSCNKTTYYRPTVIFPFYHGYTSTVMEQGIQNRKMHAISITKNKTQAWRTEHRWLIIFHQIISIYAGQQGTITLFHWLLTVVNSGKYEQQKFDFDQWWHVSNTHLWEDTSLLTCNGNVSSGKEAPLTYGRKNTTWSLRTLMYHALFVEDRIYNLTCGAITDAEMQITCRSNMLKKGRKEGRTKEIKKESHKNYL